jgi:riboflavin kinase/FMN adenylyltransferase
VSGRVVHGRGEGQPLLHVPTANLTPHKYAAIPGDGVYAGRAFIGDRVCAAGISVGVPPTFPESRDYLEAHVLGFDGDLYGAEITLEFGVRLRDQEHFDTLDELSDRIREDLERVRGLYPEDAC